MKYSASQIVLVASFACSTLGSDISARADFLTVKATVPVQATDFTLAVPGVSGFNPSLGKLTSVQLSLATSGTFDGSVKNNSSGSANFSLTEFVNFTLTGHSITALTTTLTEKQSYTALPTGNTSPFGHFAPVAVSAMVSITSGALFDLFDRGGIVSGFSLSTLTSEIVSGQGGNVKTTLITTAGGVLNVTYAFTPTPVPVPEPASLALVAFGGTVAVTWRRLRRRTSQRRHS